MDARPRRYPARSWGFPLPWRWNYLITAPLRVFLLPAVLLLVATGHLSIGRDTTVCTEPKSLLQALVQLPWRIAIGVPLMLLVWWFGEWEA